MNPTEYILSLVDRKEYEEVKLSNILVNYRKIDWNIVYECYKDIHSPLALFLMGNYCYYSKRNYVKTKDYLERSAALGDSLALNNLGYWIYYLGRGVKNDYYEAKKCLEQSAALGNSLALSNLGYLFYFRKRASDKDYYKAKEYFEQSVALGNNLALDHLRNVIDVIGFDIYVKEKMTLKKENAKLREENEILNLLPDAPGYHHVKSSFQEKVCDINVKKRV